MKKLKLERLLYIEATMLIKGNINRLHLTERYGVSIKTATRLLAQYKEECPDQMYMDNTKGKLQYNKSKTCKPCLFQNIDHAKRFLNVVDEVDSLVEKIQKSREDL